MIDFSARRAGELAAADLDGYVLKAGSPSCGLDVPVQGDRDRGVFAAALTTCVPDLPVADERELAEEASRERFVERVFAHYRQRKNDRSVAFRYDLGRATRDPL
jgi:hypothetical protein